LRRVSSRARLDFFEHGKNRLVKPAVPSPEAPPEDVKGGSDGGGNGGDGKPPSGVDWRGFLRQEQSGPSKSVICGSSV